MALAYGLSFPFMPVYFERHGLSLDNIGIILAINALAVAGGSLLGGQSTDVLGATGTIVRALKWRFLITVMMALLITAGSPPAPIALMFFAANLVGTTYIPANDAFVAKRYGFHDRNSAFSWMRVAVGAGATLGSAVGGLVAASFGYGLLFGLAAFLMYLNHLFAKKYLPQESVRDLAPATRRLCLAVPWRITLESLSNPFWKGFLCVTFLAYITQSQLYSLLSLYLSRHEMEGEFLIGLLFAWNSALVALFQMSLTKKLKAWPLTWLNAVGLAFYALGCLLMLGGKGWPWYLVAVTVATLGELIHVPSHMALTANVASYLGGARRQGFYLGLAQFIGILGTMTAGLLGGWLLEHATAISPAIAWITISILGFVASLGYLFLHGKVPLADILGAKA